MVGIRSNGIRSRSLQPLLNFVFRFSVESIERLKNLEVEYGKAIVRLKSAKANFEIQSRKCLELQQQREEFERQLDDIVRNRFENNDVLIKVHKEVMEQNSKVERAKRESRIAKKTMMKKIDDRDFVRILEVPNSVLSYYMFLNQPMNS